MEENDEMGLIDDFCKQVMKLFHYMQDAWSCWTMRAEGMLTGPCTCLPYINTRFQ